MVDGPIVIYIQAALSRLSTVKKGRHEVKSKKYREVEIKEKKWGWIP